MHFPFFFYLFLHDFTQPVLICFTLHLGTELAHLTFSYIKTVILAHLHFSDVEHNSYQISFLGRRWRPPM